MSPQQSARKYVDRQDAANTGADLAQHTLRAIHRDPLHNEKLQIRELVLTPTRTYPALTDYVLAVLWQRYDSSYQAKLDHTFQKTVGYNDKGHAHVVDLAHGNVLVENHQPRFWRRGSRLGDFSSPEAYQEFRAKLGEAETREERAVIMRETREQLISSYEANRRGLISSLKDFKDHILIVVTSPEEFHERVLVPFLGRLAPAVDRFIEEFEILKTEAYRALPDDRRGVRQGKNLGQGEKYVRPHGMNGRSHFFGRGGR